MAYSFFIDTNIWVDFYIHRPPFTQVAKELMISLHEKNHTMCTSTACVSTLIYFLEKHNTLERQKDALKNLNNLSLLIDGNNVILKSVTNSKFKDLEDALLYHIAAHHQIDYLVTRNIKDFRQEGFTQIISPEEALKLAQTEH